MADVRTPTRYDVLVIGAGGAGLRAAIEAAAAGVSVGLICKSLLGKAHTVMAEGGIAAALANVDDRDNWKVHFADTMRGGQYVNNWRMAELHAQGSARPRARARGLGRGVRPHARTAASCSATSAATAIRAWRTSATAPASRLIRTLQDHGDPPGHRRAHGAHRHRAAARTAAASPGVLAYDRERGRFHVFRAKAVVLATGGIGRAYKITSNSWEYTGDGHALAYDAGAELIDMEFIQFHPTGMVWPPSVRGILVTEGVRGEGGVLRNSEGRRFMFDDIPDNYKPQTADDEEEGWRYTQGDKNARRPPELLTRDHVARCINREVKAGRGSPHGGVFLDIAWIKEKLAERARSTSSEAAEHVPPVQGAGRPRHHEGADGGRPDDALHHGRHPRGRRHADVDRARACSPPASAPRASTARTASAATRSPTCSCSASAPASTPPRSRADPERRAAGRAGRPSARCAPSLAPFDRGGAGENPYTVQHDLQETMQALVGIVRTEAEMQRGAATSSTRCASAPAAPASPATASTTPAGTPRSICATCSTVSEAITRSALERKESRGGHFREDYPGQAAGVRHVQHRRRGGCRTARCRCRACRCRRCRPELTQIIEEQKQ